MKKQMTKLMRYSKPLSGRSLSLVYAYDRAPSVSNKEPRHVLLNVALANRRARLLGDFFNINRSALNIIVGD